MAVAHVRRGRRWRCNGRGAEQRLGVWTDVSMAGVMLRLFTFHFTRSWANKPNIDGSYRTGPRGAQRGRTNTERKGESSADGWRVGTKTQRDNEGRRGVSALSAKFCIASASATTTKQLSFLFLEVPNGRRPRQTPLSRRRKCGQAGGLRGGRAGPNVPAAVGTPSAIRMRDTFANCDSISISVLI